MYLQLLKVPDMDFFQEDVNRYVLMLYNDKGEILGVADFKKSPECPDPETVARERFVGMKLNCPPPHVFKTFELIDHAIVGETKMSSRLDIIRGALQSPRDTV